MKSLFELRNTHETEFEDKCLEPAGEFSSDFGLDRPLSGLRNLIVYMSFNAIIPQVML